MKINNINRAEQGQQGFRGVEPHDEGIDKPLVFKKTLSDLSADQREAHLSALIKGIDEQGEKLSKRADIKEFERYRKLIREFLDDVVSNGYSYSKENAFAARGRPRFFATVKTIDEKLDALAKEVLKGQSDTLAIMNQIDDIRGLILDMLL